LLLVYEPEAACRARLAAAGFPANRALEISSYLAQSTDLAPEFPAMERAFRERGIAFVPVELDALQATLDTCDPATTLIWTLTDGIAYYRGSAAPALARLRGYRTIGSDESTFALCQDKFRSGAVLSALGMPVPPAGLVRDGVWLIDPPASPRGWFVKPNRLGAKIGIWEDSRCGSLDEALALSRRVHAAYRDAVVVQPYVPGRNVRASFLAVRPDAGTEALGTVFVDSGEDFQTMDDSMALYGESGAEAVAQGRYVEPDLAPVADTRPDAARAIRGIAKMLMDGLGLKDVFSVDLRLEVSGALHLIEFEVSPGLPCFDFRAYLRAHWHMELTEAMAEAAARRLASPR
jgi:D-alanine-D-alanine ligase-like ATP-grasp enzyme